MPPDGDEDQALGQVLAFDAPARRSILSPALQARIGADLRTMYAGLKEQPLPERLAALIRQLEARSQESTREG